MSTASTQAIADTIRDRLIGFTPVVGPDLVALLGSSSSSAGSDGHVFLDQAPNDLPPADKWAILRISWSRGSADGGRLRDGVCECTLYGKGRHTQPDLEDAADVIEQAWRLWIDAGPLVARHVTSRLIVPFDNAPEYVDRERVQIRLLLPFTAAPDFLT